MKQLFPLRRLKITTWDLASCYVLGSNKTQASKLDSGNINTEFSTNTSTNNQREGGALELELIRR